MSGAGSVPASDADLYGDDALAEPYEHYRALLDLGPICAAMWLARLEATAVLTALAHRVERFELAGTPIRKLNNVIRAFASLPTRIVPAAPG